MVMYGYDTVTLRIVKFAMAPATTTFGQSIVTLSHTDALRIRISYRSVISVMNRILFAFVRICAYRVLMAFSNVLLLSE